MNLSIQTKKQSNKIAKFTLLFTVTLLLSLTFTSCEKEIELNVEQSTPKLVVEAIVTDSDDSYVRITKSKSIYDNEESGFEAINDADVTISDDEGNTYVFNNINTFGYYALEGFNGVPGRTYSLDINADGEHITGVDKMLPHVDIESITFKNIPISDDGEKQVLCHFQDNEETEDFYYFRIIETPSLTPFGTYKTGRSDLLFNGLTAEVVMKGFFGIPGSTVDVHLYHVNKENYKYLYTLGSLSGNGPFGDGTPGNPINTVEGDAIGFFGAWSDSSFEIVVP